MFLLNLIKRNKFLLFLIVLTIPSIIFLFQNGYFQSDDGEWMVIRFSSFFQALREGQIPVRFLSRLNYGYGYPVADFLYPGFMYLGVPIHLLGFNFVNTVKIILGLSMILSGVFTFFWLKKLFNQESAFFGSLFYIYAPYHLYDLTRRGSVGEVLALVVLPFILWQIERKSVFWMAVGIGFLILSHNILGFLFLSLVVLYASLSLYVSKSKRSLAKKYLIAIVLGVGLSTFFIIPGIYDLKYTTFSKTTVSDWKGYFASINLIGYTTIFVFLCTLYLFISKKVNQKEHRLTVLLFLVGISSTFLSSSLSSGIWNILPVSFIQFPFRFLSLTIVSGAFLVAFIISQVSKKNGLLIGVTTIIATVILSREYLFPTEFFNKNEWFYTTNEATTTVKDEYMPIWLKNKPSEHPKDKIEVIEGMAEISNIKINSNEITFNISSQENSKIQINTVYFPGWRASLNGKRASLDYKENGLIMLNIPSGESRMVVKFGETPLRIISDIISVLSFGLLLIYNLRLKRNESG